MAVKEWVDTLNGLLQGEQSAVETYGQVVSRLSAESKPEVAELRRFDSEHRDAVTLLRRQIELHEGQPVATSGPWGAWARTVTGTAQVLGDRSALKALKEGEEHGLKLYEDALSQNKLDPDCEEVVRSTLLPRTRAHVQELDRMIKVR
jgi:stress response protein YsnF